MLIFDMYTYIYIIAESIAAPTRQVTGGLSGAMAVTTDGRWDVSLVRSRSPTRQGGNKCHNPDFLGCCKTETMVVERFMGVRMCLILCCCY